MFIPLLPISYNSLPSNLFTYLPVWLAFDTQEDSNCLTVARIIVWGNWAEGRGVKDYP